VRFLLILQREYLQIVGKKSFLFSTLLVPLLGVLMGIVAPLMLGGNASTPSELIHAEQPLSPDEVTQIIALFLALSIYIFVLSYGGMIMSGVVEEKASRIVEVILSACRPIELMFGKIFGVASVGLTQFVIWMLLFLLTALFVDLDSEFLVLFSSFQPQLRTILPCYLLYFLGGYLLYAAIFAACGSAVDQQQDASQFMKPIVCFMLFALYTGIFSVEDPDGSLAWWCSMIPFTSPVTMMVRLPFSVSVWELFLSLLLLYATALLFLYLASRIYRINILHYGQKFSWRKLYRKQNKINQ